jgi:hypothetical protein
MNDENTVIVLQADLMVKGHKARASLLWPEKCGSKIVPMLI